MSLPVTPSPQEFGAALRRLREERGVTIESIAAKTKISRRILQALEDGDFRLLPNHVFVRLFLRQYLDILPEDPEPWLTAYDAAWAQFERDSRPWPVIEPPPPRGRRVGPWILGALIVLAALFAVLLIERRQSGGSGGALAPTPEVSLPTPAPVPTEPAPATPTPVEESTDVLVIRATVRPCWVEVQVNGEEAMSRLLEAGDSWKIEAAGRPVSLLVGDAGAAEVSYLGTSHNPVGAPGEVARLHLGPAAPAQGAGT
jgi:cytoskeleton protein RodZ